MSDENGQSTLQNKIKEGVTFVGGVGAISYAAGFIVETTRLLNYGIIDWNLLSARYLSAGFLFIILLGIAIAPTISFIMFISEILSEKFPIIRLEEPHKSDKIVYSLFHQYNQKVPKIRSEKPHKSDKAASKQSHHYNFDSHKICMLIILFLIVPLVPAIAISIIRPDMWLGDIVSSDAIWKLVTHSLILYPTLLRIWFTPLFITGILLYLIIHQSKKKWLSEISIRWLLIGFVVISLLVMVTQYSRDIYPFITEAVGGGAGVDVSLVFDNESAQTAMQLKIPLNTTNFTTPPLRLLGENDKNYYFLIPEYVYHTSPVLSSQKVSIITYEFNITYESFHAVEIDKGLIKGLIYNASINIPVNASVA